MSCPTRCSPGCTASPGASSPTSTAPRAGRTGCTSDWPGSPPDEDEDLSAERIWVVEALHRLSDADQEVLRLSAWEDLSGADIAAVLNCSNSAAAVRLHRARQRLRALMAQDPDAPDDPRPTMRRLTMVDEMLLLRRADPARQVGSGGALDDRARADLQRLLQDDGSRLRPPSCPSCPRRCSRPARCAGGSRWRWRRVSGGRCGGGRPWPARPSWRW